MFCSIPIVRLLAACAPVDPERGTRDGDESLPGESGAELSLHDRKAEKRQMRTLTCRREPEVQVGFCLRAHSRPLADAVNRPLSHSACRPLSNAGIVEG